MSPTKEELLKQIELSESIHDVALHFGVNWRTVKGWYRWKEINLKPEKEELFEDCKKLTDKEIGKKYKVSDKTINKWKKEYGISKKTMRKNSIPSELTEEQLDLITGKLLGDGWIEKVRTENRCINTSFGVEHCSEQFEYIKKNHKLLEPFSLPLRKRVRNNPFYENSNHKEKITSFTFKTKACPVFTNLRSKWYPDGSKIIPKDINLNWRTLAIWYCDDGSSELGQRCIRRHGKLCTNDFFEADVDFLIGELNKKGIKSHIFFQAGQPLIHLHKDTFMYFIENVKPYIPWKCFGHKLLTNENIAAENAQQ